MNKIYFNIAAVSAIIFAAHIFAKSQIAQGGNFSLDQSVIASGGGDASSGSYSLTGTIGQSAAGTDSTNGGFSLKGGFWTTIRIAPTAASANIEGRILTANGQGIRNVIVILTDSNGAIRSTSSGTFGFFKFDDLTVGNVYTITLLSKRYQFEQPSQVLYLLDNVADLRFTAVPQ